MLIQAILLGLIAIVANCDYLLGTALIQRPLITGLLTGMVLGDVKKGIILGATLELAFMGAFSIGAALPPDMISGCILGTAFAISTGKGAAVALTLGIPIASLVLIVKNVILIFVLPLIVHKADAYAEKGDCRGVELMQIIGGPVLYIPVAIIVSVSFYLGSPVMKAFLSSIPSFVTNGLTIATGLLPALGFALLARMIINKSVIIFLILGFGLSAYGSIPVTGIAIFGAILAIILVRIENKQRVATATDDGGVSDDF